MYERADKVAVDLVLRQVLRWVDTTVACGYCVKLNEMGVW